MEMRQERWPPETKSVFIDGSSEDTNQEFRDNPLLGCHKHGPACAGKVRAVIYPLSPAARSCCEAEPKREDESPFIVKLRLCTESTHFLIGTSLCGNLTLRRPELIDDHDEDWKHQICVQIYPDPETDHAELFNASPSLPISVSPTKSRPGNSVRPWESFPLEAACSWVIKITETHTFGLVLRPSSDVYQALVKHVTSNENQEFRHIVVPKVQSQRNVESAMEGGKEVREVQQIKHASVSTLLNQSSQPLVDKSVESKVLPDERPPSPSGNDAKAIILFQNRATTVEELQSSDKIWVRKTIRGAVLRQAAIQWERETSILSQISHLHVVQAIKWNPAKLSIDFEHGGKDLATLTTGTNMFNVAINLEDVRKRIWVHVTSALEYLHEEKKIKHLDIKPRNILLSNDHQICRLCDLGHARNIQEQVRGGGTHHYIAPEFLSSNEMSAASDIWALGVTMLFVLNIIPLPGSEPDAKVWQINKLQKDPKERRKMIEWIRTVSKAKEKIPKKWSLLREMLDLDPKTRITARALSQKLKSLTKENSERQHLLLA